LVCPLKEAGNNEQKWEFDHQPVININDVTTGVAIGATQTALFVYEEASSFSKIVGLLVFCIAAFRVPGVTEPDRLTHHQDFVIPPQSEFAYR